MNRSMAVTIPTIAMLSCLSMVQCKQKDKVERHEIAQTETNTQDYADLISRDAKTISATLKFKNPTDSIEYRHKSDSIWQDCMQRENDLVKTRLKEKETIRNEKIERETLLHENFEKEKAKLDKETSNKYNQVAQIENLYMELEEQEEMSDRTWELADSQSQEKFINALNENNLKWCIAESNLEKEYRMK